MEGSRFQKGFHAQRFAVNTENENPHGSWPSPSSDSSRLQIMTLFFLYYTVLPRHAVPVNYLVIVLSECPGWCAHERLRANLACCLVYIKTGSHLLQNLLILSIILLPPHTRSLLSPSWLDTLYCPLNKTGRCMPPRLLLWTTPRLRKSTQTSSPNSGLRRAKQSLILSSHQWCQLWHRQPFIYPQVPAHLRPHSSSRRGLRDTKGPLPGTAGSEEHPYRKVPVP